MQRASMPGDKTSLYATRILDESPVAGVGFYRGVGGVRRLRLDSGPAELAPIHELVEEAPDEFPVLVSNGGDEIYESVLPTRPTQLRVCSRFGHGAAYLTTLDEKERARLRAFSQQTIGVDLVRYAEHLGAVHLCMANPLLRAMTESLGRDDRDLLVRLYERIGRAAHGCHLRLSDHRSGGVGFDLEVEVTSSRMVVPLPYSPQLLETRLYSPDRDLLAHSRAGFIREVGVDLGLIGGERRIETRTATGTTKVETVRTVSWDIGPTAKEVRHTAVSNLGDAIDRRRMERDSASFFFFAGESAERDRARQVVRKLIGAARDRCLLCDPYLSADDLSEYAAFTTTRGMPIRLLTSASFLSRRRKGTPDEGKRLLERIQYLSSQDPSLRLECRVLRGRKASPVHDRFLMLDADVFLLGSSLAELGSRATAIYRVPPGARLPAVLEGWWNDRTKSETLEEWLTERRKEPEK